MQNNTNNTGNAAVSPILNVSAFSSKLAVDSRYTLIHDIPGSVDRQLPQQKYDASFKLSTQQQRLNTQSLHFASSSSGDSSQRTIVNETSSCGSIFVVHPSRILASVCGAANMNIHVRSQLVLHGKRSAADIAKVGSLLLVHGPRVPLQHVSEQESLAALRALESPVATVRQNVPLQLAAPGELLGADMADVLLLTGMENHVVGQLARRLADPRAHRTHETRARGLRLDTVTAAIADVRPIGLVNQPMYAQLESTSDTTIAFQALVRLGVL